MKLCFCSVYTLRKFRCTAHNCLPKEAPEADSCVVCMQTVQQARMEQANGSGRAGTEERVLPDHKAFIKEKDAHLQVIFACRHQYCQKSCRLTVLLSCAC